MVQGILIDLDDTLADDQFATKQAVISLCKSRSLKLHEHAEELTSRWLALLDKHWRRFRAGEITLQGQRRERLRELLDQNLSDGEADQMFNEYLSYYEKNWRLVPDAQHFLACTVDVPKVIVTNGETSQVSRKVAALNLRSHFIGVVTPEEAGASKPQPEIFLYALKLLGLPASGCLMIGDSHEFDIKPAQAIGMATFHVCTELERGLCDAVRAI